MAREEITTVEQVRNAGPGVWWDREGAQWTHTLTGDWLDFKGNPSAKFVARPGIDRRYADDMFLAMIGLSRSRPSWLAGIAARATAERCIRRYRDALHAYAESVENP